MATVADYSFGSYAVNYSLIYISISIPVSGSYRVRITNYNTGGLIVDTYVSGSASYSYSTSASTYYRFSCVVFDTSGEMFIKYTDLTTPSMPVQRPSYFYWSITKTSGQSFYVTATEWNNLIDNIRAMQSYKGLSVGGMIYVNSGNDFSAFTFNQVRAKLNELVTTSLPTAYTGDPIYAWYFSEIQNKLNSIS